MAQFISEKMIPWAPRKVKRHASRVYANAAYRRINKLDHELYGSTEHGYVNQHPHPDVVSYTVRLYNKYYANNGETASNLPSGTSSDGPRIVS